MSTELENKAVVATVQKWAASAQLTLLVVWTISVVLATLASESIGFGWFLFNLLGGVALGSFLGVSIAHIVAMVEKVQENKLDRLDSGERMWYERFKRWSGSAKNPS